MSHPASIDTSRTAKTLVMVEAAMRHLSEMRRGQSATLIGLSGDTLLTVADAARLGDRRLLLVEPPASRGAEAAIAGILEDLAELALAAWPDWPAPNEAVLVPVSWRRAAGRLADAGRRPLFRSVAAQTQFCALHAASTWPILVVPLDPARPAQAASLIAAMEWCRRRGAATVALLSESPASEPPWDRILHGALVVAAPPPASALSPPTR